MWPQTITTSRTKTILYLLVSATFTAIGVGITRAPETPSDVWKGGFAAIFFGLCALVFVWLLIRPRTLKLDADGFMLEGGTVRAPKRTPWRDIDRFFVYRSSHGVKLIGYNYRPGRAPPSRLAPLMRLIGPEAGLPKDWPMSPEALVELLEAYRTGTYRPAAPKVVE